MQTTILLILAAVLLCRAECVDVRPQRYGRVEVSVFSFLGERIPNPTIDLIEAGTRKSLKAEFRGSIATRIPYGSYTLRASAPGFQSTQLQLRLDQPEVIIRTPLSVRIECDGFAEIAGSIDPAPLDRELWVKLVPVLGSGGAEARVSRHGIFLVSGLDAGDYLLLVLDGKTIVHTETCQIAGSRRISVSLSKP
jgi:hypothetical protein